MLYIVGCVLFVACSLFDVLYLLCVFVCYLLVVGWSLLDCWLLCVVVCCCVCLICFRLRGVGRWLLLGGLVFGVCLRFVARC